jgi:ABC-type uncharacterized transport system involved in gliding motility auxiliary subunit
MADDIEERLRKIEDALNRINEEIGELRGKMDSEQTLVKWVIFPLLLIMAGLVGIKLALP